MEYANSALNFAWVAVCVAAFTWFLLSTARREGSRRVLPSRVLLSSVRMSSVRMSRVLMCRALALGLALVSLFPSVSASDDSIRMDLLDAQLTADSSGQSSWSAHHKPADELLAVVARLLEVLESAQVTAILAFSVTLCSFALALALAPASADRFLPSCPGRAPPRGSPVAV
jgi:hypothetical protein